jgi:hypothetical protein
LLRTLAAIFPLHGSRNSRCYAASTPDVRSNRSEIFIGYDRVAGVTCHSHRRAECQIPAIRDNVRTTLGHTEA